MRLRNLRVDCPANEGMVSVAFHVLLNANGLVSKLLEGEVMKKSRVDQFDIVSEVVVTLLSSETFEGCCKFIR